MSRNLLALLLTSSLYIIVGAMLLYAPLSVESIAPPKDNIIKISMVAEPTPEPQLIQKPEPIEPKPIPEPIPEPQPIPKPIPKPKPKKVVKKKPIKKQVIKKTKKIATKRTHTKQKTSHKATGKEAATSSQKASLKKKFLRHVKSNIQKNKKYPRVAVRRGIEGHVRIVFDIQKSGAVTNIRISGGHITLQKASKSAIQRSFPIAVPLKLRSSLPIRNVALTLGFTIR